MSKHLQLIKYIFAGGCATGSNLLVLFICVNYFKLWYLIGAIIAFCIGVIISYTLQKFFVFKNYSKDGMHKQFSVFFLFAAIMLGVNTLLMYLFVDIIGLWYLLAQTISAFIVAFINYTFFSKVIFNNDK